MKIDHGSCQAYMPKTFLYIQKAFPILQEMRSRRMSQCMNSDRAVVAGLHQCILKDDADISRLDGLWGNPLSMCLENKVFTGKPFLEDTQQD
jgi:hypothetical protein